MRALKRRLLSTVTVTGMVASVLALAAPVQAASFTVTTTADSGAGSLRQAINDANLSAGLDVITFSLPPGVQTIPLQSSLPWVSGPVTIDGQGQVVLDGALTPAVGLHLNGGSSTIRGLVFNNFGTAIELLTAGGNTIAGNYIGVTADGLGVAGNQYGIYVFNTSPNNTIGGTAAADRNVISGSTSGAVIINSNGNTILNNYVGTNAAGTGPLGNGSGITVQGGANNVIGAAGAGNVISASGGLLDNSWGVFITGPAASGNKVQGNLIGTRADGTTGMGNFSYGVGFADSASNATIGGGLPGQGNVIAFNKAGVVASSGGGTCCGHGISVLSNSIFSNDGLGIDLGDNAVTPNDLGDPDTGPNNLQNFPVSNSVSVTNGSATFNGALNSEANKTYRIEFFKSAACDASGNGEGQTFIDTMDAVTDASGNANVSKPNLGGANAVAVGDYITATATDPNGNTSEFSACKQATAAPGAPTNVTAGAGDASAVVSWAPPVWDGGSPITGYIVAVASPPGAGISPVSVPASARSATVPGLTNGTTYTFDVTATNSVGTGPAATTAGVTPQAGQPPATSTTQTVAAGGTVNTGTVPSSTDPTVTSVTVPSGGTVSIAESSPELGATPPGGRGTFVGQQSDITAPTATASSPLVITLKYDSTVVNTSKPLHTYRTEGTGPETLVPDCLGTATALSDGSPCVTSRSKDSVGDWTVKVNTAAASRWRSGQPDPSRIDVNPTSASTSVGATAQLTAAELFSDGSIADVSSIASWTSSDSAVATVSTAGLVTGKAAGSTTISVTFDSLTPATSSVTVTGTTTTGTKTVAVSDSGFSPKALALPAQDYTVQWSFAAANTRSHNVTDSSGMNLFSSGLRTARVSSSYSFRFFAAGTYLYKSTAGEPTVISGSIKVPLKVSPLSGGATPSYTVTWASAAQSGYFSDVQYRYKPCAKTVTCTWQSWTNWQTGQATAVSAAFTTKGAGTYQLHARLGKQLSSTSKKYSGWSVAATISVA